MGINSIKCEGDAMHATKAKSVTGETRASDFNTSNEMKEVLAIVAVGGAVATVGGFALAYGANWFGERTPPDYMFPEANKTSEGSGQVSTEFVFKNNGDVEKIDGAFTDRHYRIELVGINEDTNPFYNTAVGYSQPMRVCRALFNITDISTSDVKTVRLENGQSLDIDGAVDVRMPRFIRGTQSS